MATMGLRWILILAAVAAAVVLLTLFVPFGDRPEPSPLVRQGVPTGLEGDAAYLKGRPAGAELSQAGAGSEGVSEAESRSERECTRFAVAGLVLEEDGRPCSAGVVVRAGYMERARHAAEGVTDTYGRFALEGGPAAYQPMALLLEALDASRGLRSRPHAFPVDRPTAVTGECVLRLQKGLLLQLRAVDAAGAPAAGATFFVRRSGAGRPLAGFEISAAYAQHAYCGADEEGRAGILVQPGSFWLYARAPNGPFGPGLRKVMLEPGAGPVIDVEVGGEAANVALAFEDGNGNPVPHAWLALPPPFQHLINIAKDEKDHECFPAGSLEDTHHDMFLWADQDGRLRLDGLDAGPDPMVVAVGSPNHVLVHIDVDRTGTTTEAQRVTLLPRSTLELRFSPSLKGVPALLEGAWCVATPIDSPYADLSDTDPLADLAMALGEARTEVDHDTGRISLALPTPGAYSIDFFLPGGWGFSGEFDVDVDEHAVELVRLPPGRVVHLQLEPTGFEHVAKGAPSRVEIRLTPQPNRGGNLPGEEDGPTHRLRSWRWDARPGDPPLAIWLPDEVTAVVATGATSVDAFPGLPARLDIAPGSEPSLTLALDWDALSTLEVVVELAEDSPYDGPVEVTVFGRPAKTNERGPMMIRPGGVRSQATDAGCRAVFRLPPGTYDVEASREDLKAPGRATVVVEVERASEVRLTPR